MNIIGEVQGKNILIVDDLVDTAGTLVNAVEALRNAGAASVYAACTHAVLSGEAIERINTSRLEMLLVTDTLPLRVESPKIAIESVSTIFGEAVRRSFNHESISSLFDVDKS